jgi:hypothetical protein
VKKAAFLAVLAMTAASAMVLAGAGSAAKPARAATPALHPVTIRIAGVVRQVGARNYAGPNCPGAGWNCTTSTRVLQIATAGGANVAQCTNGIVDTSAGQKCTIEQHGTNNTARCFERVNSPDASQLCDITQTGARNTAIVDQQIVGTNNASERGDQTATVTQGAADAGAASLNNVQVNQRVMQNSGGNGNDPAATSQDQEAYQIAEVTQFASGTGSNQSNITQSEDQFAHGSAVQTQSMTPNGTDCAPAVGAFGPHICANVAQHGENGKNTNALNQSLNQRADSNSAAADQTQGSFGGGIDGQIHQDTTVGGSGSSTNTANQSKRQLESAPAGAIQTQIDPISCCGFASQVGGTGNSETIHQNADLHASEALADQFLDLEGTSNTDGTCTFDQHATINLDSASQAQTLGPPCPFASASIECTSSDFDGEGASTLGDVVLQQSEGGGCLVFPPETD